MLKLIRRAGSPYYYIRGTVRRIRVTESTGTDNKRIAEEVKAKRESEILAQSIYGRAATATFAEAVVSYIEAGGSKRFLEGPLEHFRTIPLAKIDQEAIELGARKVYPNASGSTRNRQFYTPTSAVLKHAAKRGWCSTVILERPKATKQTFNWLRPEQAERLIDACSPHLRPLVIFLLLTGARAGEALWLDWHNVDLARAQVTFPKTKNGQPRTVPLHRRVQAVLANLPHREAEVFRRPDGLPYERPDPENDQDQSGGTRIKTAFKAAVRRAGLKDIRVHDCRHTWATWHYGENRNLTALQELGGWKSASMVLRYAHANVDQHRASIDALPGETGTGTKLVQLDSGKGKSA